MLRNVFNIRLSCSFWDTLAEVYLKRYADNDFGLSNVLFLLPNRRACQALTAAFVRKQGLKPTILPQICPIAELDDDELFFNEFAYNDILKNIKPTISREERLFLFIRLILSKPNNFGLRQISLSQAANLALDLANIIDTAHNQGLSFDNLDNIVPEKYATHWQETLKLLKIITEFWPQILQERGAVDVCEVQNDTLRHQADIWRKEQTQKNIVVAGVTANFPAIVDMLSCVKELKNGEIYFAGIDCFADDIYWEAIDETSPQFELKNLLVLLNINKNEISDVTPPQNQHREHFISEVMRPASISDKWLSVEHQGIDINKAINNVSLINCKTQRDEALIIALKLRQVLTCSEKTAAFVTYDRNLARRVAAELERFDIKIDDSAGLPLDLSPVGVFLRLIAEAAIDENSEVKFIALLKNPFTLCGESASDFRKKVYTYESSIRQRIANKDISEHETFRNNVMSFLDDFIKAIHSPKIKFSEILSLHIKTAEALAKSNNLSGDKILWRGNSGVCAAKFITKMLSFADTLGEINGNEYLQFLCVMMGGESVRANYGTHPRLSILGPIEARLNYFDYVILGEINEGVWPKPTQADMWMSRPMKKNFGFDLPEKSIGILAADLCCFLAAGNVIMTRAERVDGVPMKKSRWLLRMETVLKALGTDIEALTDYAFADFANHIDIPNDYKPIKIPAPCPPVDSRPRKLSASAVDLLVCDPYSVYAKYILKLYPLDELDASLDQRDYGNIVHSVIEEFNNIYPNVLPDNMVEILLDLGHKHFSDMNLSKDIEAFWWPKFEKTIMWIAEQEKQYRNDVKKVNNEIKGEIHYDLPGGSFCFTAKADRIDELKNGKINIVDYKTGNIPTKKQVVSGHALQLPLEALIASKGGFDGLASAEVESLIYWQLGKTSLQLVSEQDDLLDKCETYLLKLATTFDFPNTPYNPRPIPKFVPKNRDYEHLSRIKEWSISESGGNNE